MAGPYSAPSNASVAALLFLTVTGNSTDSTIISQPHLQRPPPKSCCRYLQIISAPALCTAAAGWSITATKNHFNLDKIACKLSTMLAHQPKHLQRRGAVSKRCAWPVLCTCCTLLAYLIHAVCAEPVHSRCHLNCAVGNQPKLPALGWMIGRDGYAQFVRHRRAPAGVATFRGFAKPLHAVRCYYTKLLFALCQTGYTPRATLSATAAHL